MRMLLTVVMPAILSSPAWAADDMRSGVIARCADLMSGHGAHMVKACVDRDLEAAEALASYPSSAAPVIDRCRDLMGDHSWYMVQVCTDRDLEAAEALASY